MDRILFGAIAAVSMIVGGLLIRRVGRQTNHDGIGSFTLLPLAGFIYLFGLLLLIVGSLMLLFALFA